MEMTVSRTSDNKYSFGINPFKKFTSADSDDAFNKLLEDLPDLNKEIIPSVLTPEIESQIKAAEESLIATYLNAKVASVPPIPTPAIPTNMSSAYTSATPNTNTNTSASASVAPANKVKPKPCFGDYHRMQASTAPVDIALKPLCNTCPYKADCMATA
jgi:hypothetical protein